MGLKQRPNIAICITTFNRPEVLYRGLIEQLRYLPEDSHIYIYDDGSTAKPDYDQLKSICEAAGKADHVTYYEAPQNRGIAAAKNACLEFADEIGAEQIFLFDSDTWPRKDGWEKPYIQSREPHLMYIFIKFAVEGKNGHNLSDCEEIYRDSEIVAFNHVRGCMLYLDRKVLDVVGGFDVRYGKAMFEHTDFSNRIHNTGLTSFRVMDVPESQELIYSMDEYREVGSSISAADRRTGLLQNRELYQRSLTSKEFCRFKEVWSGSRDIVLTGYFTSTPDFQRGNQQWEAERFMIEPLEKSVKEKSAADFVLLHDCFDEPNKVECTTEVYMNRFLRAYQYLRDNEDVRRVFIVDATDVKMLNNPFDQMEYGKLYIGDEHAKLSIKWIRDRAQQEPLRSFVMSNLNVQLLNAGIIGGSREDVMMLLHDIFSLFADMKMKPNDMVVLNYLMRTRYADKLVHGTGLVNNRFKSFEPTEAATEWFMHK